MSGAVTVKQLLQLLKGEVAWIRIYPDGQRRDYVSCMGQKEIQEAEYIYGDRAVWRIYPGMGFAFLYLI